MARARVTTARFVDGDVPYLCAKTGEPADGWLVVPAGRLPAWIYLLLLLFGVLPLLIALVFAPERVTGLVPLGGRATQRLRTGRVVRWTMLLLGLGLLAVAMASGATAALWASIALLAGAVLTYVLEVLWSVGGRLEADGEHVVLTGIHPSFRSALAASAKEPADG